MLPHEEHYLSKKNCFSTVLTLLRGPYKPQQQKTKQNQRPCTRLCWLDFLLCFVCFFTGITSLARIQNMFYGCLALISSGLELSISLRLRGVKVKQWNMISGMQRWQMDELVSSQVDIWDWRWQEELGSMIKRWVLK